MADDVRGPDEPCRGSVRPGEPRRRARSLVLGLLSDLPRKNCWTIAEHAGDATPDGAQHLLGRAKWDADAVRDDIRTYVVDHLGDEEAVLVVDETGDLKKGTATVGVQRQYTGTAGRIENAQVAVYLVYSATSWLSLRRATGPPRRTDSAPRSHPAVSSSPHPAEPSLGGDRRFLGPAPLLLSNAACSVRTFGTRQFRSGAYCAHGRGRHPAIRVSRPVRWVREVRAPRRRDATAEYR
jgi:hypothetical protein